MLTFSEVAAQGDLLLRRVDKLPEGLKAAEPDAQGNFVVAHSETGHNHTVAGRTATLMMQEDYNPMVCYLSVAEPTDLVHHRGFDTHKTITIAPGNYEIRRQREYTPEGWRRVED